MNLLQKRLGLFTLSICVIYRNCTEVVPQFGYGSWGVQNLRGQWENMIVHKSRKLCIQGNSQTTYDFIVRKYRRQCVKELFENKSIEKDAYSQVEDLTEMRFSMINFRF